MARKKELKFHRHADCARANLIRYTGDPLLAKCETDGEVHVASTLTPCLLFRQRTKPAEIENRKKKLALTDIEI